MDDLIVKRLCGLATDLEIHRVDQWRRAAEGNERRFRELSATWSLVGAAPDGPEPASPPPVASIVAVAEARRRRGRAHRRGRGLLRSPWLGWGLAAAAVAAHVLGGLERRGGGDSALLRPTRSSTMAGDVMTMSLSDGSVVRLAPSTQLQFPSRARRREVVLSGRAFFSVAPAATPFVVRTAAGRITVHGTRFEVRTEGAAVRVIVVEGVVSLEAEAGGAVDVSPGQVAYLEAGSVARVVDHADVWSLLDWPAGLLLFQATPLREVAAELDRHFGRSVRVDPELETRRVTAWFEDEPLDEVVAAVCLVAGARCVVSDSLVTMTVR